VSAIAAETAQRADELALAAALSMVRLRSGHPGPLPSPQEAAAYPWTDGERHMARAFARFATVGDAATAYAGIQARGRTAGADELMVTTAIHDPAERRRSYVLLSEAARTVAV
jgi:alkanesulfonate monooxygenase SsuD/methylene tetrahydromethanopterin reductase-like flavin-dependent oxidoreductase (luciferase family)